MRDAFERIRITPSTRTDRRSLAVLVVERMKAQDERLALARARRRAEKVFPPEDRQKLASAVADHDGQEVSGKYPSKHG
jgi:hypothetical protein